MIINPTKMLWLFILAFYQRKSGEVCNHENSVITTEKECTKALLKLGYEVKKGYLGFTESKTPKEVIKNRYCKNL